METKQIKPKQNPKDWVKAESLSYKQTKELTEWLSSDIFDLTPSLKEIVRKLKTQVQNHKDMYGGDY